MKTSPIQRLVLSLLCFIVTGLFTGLVAYGGGLRTVAISGQSTSTPPGTTFWVFGAPALNEAGQTSFVGFLQGPGIDEANERGLWSETSGALELAARYGEQAPGTPAGMTFTSLFNPTISDSGSVGFLAKLKSAAPDGDESIWIRDNGGLHLVTRYGSTGTQITPTATFASIGIPSFNDVGHVAFSGRVAGAGITTANDEAIWSQVGSALVLVAREGDAAPGISVGGQFGNGLYAPYSPVLNSAGQVAFWGRLKGTGVNSSNEQGIWTGAAGSLQLIAREGNSAPGTEAGVQFSDLQSPTINEAGGVAFSAAVRGPEVSSLNGSGIWTQRGGSLELVVRGGQHAPGMGDGFYLPTFGQFALNHHGQVAFTAGAVAPGLAADANEGLWIYDASGLSLVAREGNQAPGTTDGVNFGAMGYIEALGLNDAGQVAFQVGLVGQGVDALNDRGIWATDRVGDLKLIIRTGQLMEVQPGDFRTVHAIGGATNFGNGSGRASAFNNRGQITFWAGFTDGSQGIFVSDAVAVPEPAALLLLGVAIVALHGSHRGSAARRF